MIDTSLTVKELARRWRCRPSTIRTMIRRGSLPAIVIGRSIRITPESILAAETRTLAVRPRRLRHVDRVPDEVLKMLG